MTNEQWFAQLDDRLANLEELVGLLRHIDLKTSEEVSRQDLTVAIIEGVRLGLADLLPASSPDNLYDAVRQGVRDGILGVAYEREAFYDSIMEGVRAAMVELKPHQAESE
jgi:hypothetical protein